MLTIYLKPTNYCNVGCDHCYLPESVRAEKGIMSEDQLRQAARLAKDLADREKSGPIHFIWHGGEPLMLPPEYYLRANEVLLEELGDTFTQSLQTSLIPYHEKWSKVVDELFDGHIGSSVDFTQRKIKDSSSAYLDRWMEKVKLARSHGHFVLPGMVPTRHEINNAPQIIEWMVDNGFKAFNVERFSKFGTQTIDWPSNRLHAQFLKGLFDETVRRLKATGVSPVINVVAASIMAIVHGMPGDRWGTRCQREFLVVEPDGSINTCPDRAKHEEPYSNIGDGVNALITSEGRRNWIRVMDVTHKKDHCSVCEFRSFCRSGCPVTPNGPSEGQEECSGYKSHLLHVQRYCQEHPEDVEMLVDYAQRRRSGFELVPNIRQEAS